MLYDDLCKLYNQVYAPSEAEEWIVELVEKYEENKRLIAKEIEACIGTSWRDKTLNIVNNGSEKHSFAKNINTFFCEIKRQRSLVLEQELIKAQSKYRELKL